MPSELTKCAVERGGSTFTRDGHPRCVKHRGCTLDYYVYDPFQCDICREAFAFLKIKRL